MLAILAYYAGIMLNAFATPLCSKLSWHNRLKPALGLVHILINSKYPIFKQEAAKKAGRL